MNQNNLNPKVIEVSESEIEQTSRAIEEMYDMVLPHSESERLAKLIKELALWQKAEESLSQSLERVRSELREIVQTSDEKTEAYKLTEFVPLKERLRIVGAIREIILQYRPIENSPSITEKTARLVSERYGKELTQDQLEQTIQYLTRKLWAEEGVNSSLEDCLIDILSHQTAHQEVLAALDQVIHTFSQR